MRGKASLQFDYFNVAAAAAKSLQSCPTLCDPIDGSPPGPAKGTTCHLIVTMMSTTAEKKKILAVAKHFRVI